MAEVGLLGLTKRFGNVVAVDEVTLSVGDGEFMALVGPSGCGKSTILRLLAGLEAPTAGEIYLDDRMVNQVSPRDRDIAMVFQNYALYPNKNVYENMAFGLKLRKLPKGKIEERVREAAGILGIEGLLDRRPHELSGGQRQRVAMGRAIVRKPRLFLFDEPLSNLDAKLRFQMRGELARLRDSLGTTAVYVTHDQIEAMTLAHRVAILNRGKIMQVGPPLEVYNRPRNIFTAGFMGSPAMNLIQGRVIVEEGAPILLVEGSKVALPRPWAEKCGNAAGREVIFGIRPQDIHDGESEAGSREGQIIKVHVEVVEPVGPEVIVLSTFGSSRLTACLDPRTRARPRQEMTLFMDLNRMHLFDKITGLRI